MLFLVPEFPAHKSCGGRNKEIPYIDMYGK